MARLSPFPYLSEGLIAQCVPFLWLTASDLSSAGSEKGNPFTFSPLGKGQRLHGCTGLMSRVHKSETTALLFPQSLPHSSCNFLSEYCVLATLAYMELRGLKWSTTFINRGAQLTVSTALLASFLCKMELCLYQCSFLSKKQRTAAAKQYKQILWLRCIQ